MPKIKFKTRRIENAWWVEDPKKEHLEEPVGPYRTKSEADEERIGLERFFNVDIHKKP